MEQYRARVKQLGFKRKSTRIETDYLPDTPDGLCKRNGLLLRFRENQTSNSTTWLLTLKKRSAASGIMDFEEIETDFGNPDNETFEHINQLVRAATGRSLDKVVLRSTDLSQVREAMRSCGFTKERILLDKYREEYGKARSNITLDFFPDGMGAYLEVEAHSKAKLDVIVFWLQISSGQIITTDYGNLLKEYKRNLPPKRQRVALFTPAQRLKLLGK